MDPVTTKYCQCRMFLLNSESTTSQESTAGSPCGCQKEAGAGQSSAGTAARPGLDGSFARGGRILPVTTTWLLATGVCLS